MKLALVHDFLTQEGGAEKVLEAFLEIYPESPLFVLFYDKKKMSSRYQNYHIRTSFLQKMPLALKKYQWYLPLMPAATESLDLCDFDVVLSSTSAFAKGIITKPDTKHICYCHTPTRYLWNDTHEYLKELRVPKILKKVIPFSLNKLRLWDRLAAERVNHFIANSYNVQKRIQKYYQKPSVVIHPPIELAAFGLKPVQNYFLTGGRLVPYKRYDLTITAFNKLGCPLKIFGTGPDYKRLKKLAAKNIKFLGKITDDEKSILYSQAQAFIHPQEEDFGITPIESMASGRPVIAYRKGGVLETVNHQVNGLFFEKQDETSLLDILKNFKAENFDSQIIRNSVLHFDKEVFKQKIKNYITETVSQDQ